MLDSAPDAFVTVDAERRGPLWNHEAERIFGWTRPRRSASRCAELITPAEVRDRHASGSWRWWTRPGAGSPIHYEVEIAAPRRHSLPRRESVSRVDVRGEQLLAGFIRDVRERKRRLDEREALLRAEAARAEAERIAGMVSGLQVLVDAALTHRTLDEMLADLVTRMRAVLDADAAAIELAADGALTLPPPPGGDGAQRSSPERRWPGEGFAGCVARSVSRCSSRIRRAAEMPYARVARARGRLADRAAAAGEGEVTGVILVGVPAPRHFTDDDENLLRLAADAWRSPSTTRACSSASTGSRRRSSAACCRSACRSCRGCRRRRATCPPPRRPRSEATGTTCCRAERRVGLVMGDVAGKGLAAASMVGRLRSALRAYALEGHQPARVVEQLNRLIWTEEDDSQMATLIYVVLDPVAEQLRWVNAGHPPALLLNDGRTPEFLEGGSSVPLGVLPFPEFEESSVAIDQGATVVLYTDGLVERPGEHIDVGLDRLADAVRGTSTDPQQICDRVLRELVPDVGAPDDVAMLTLRTIPMSDRFAVELPTEPEALASMRAVLRRWLRHVDGTEHEIAEVVTACGEAATNAIEHAGTGVPFEISGQANGRTVEIEVRDHGGWRPPREGDRGRGISLMQALMDTVDVEPTPDGTTVRMQRTLLDAKANGDHP